METKSRPRCRECGDPTDSVCDPQCVDPRFPPGFFDADFLSWVHKRCLPRVRSVELRHARALLFLAREDLRVGLALSAADLSSLEEAKATVKHGYGP